MDIQIVGPSGNNAWTASSINLVSNTFVYPWHSDDTYPAQNYISPTGQFGEYRHKSCIRHRSRISQFDWHHRLQLTPQNNSASTRADFLHY